MLWLPAGSVRAAGSLDSPAVLLCVVNLSNRAPWGVENCLKSPRELVGGKLQAVYLFIHIIPSYGVGKGGLGCA